MNLGIACAILSSLSLAAMILFDRLMMGDCYRNKADHAWIVSSIAGSTLGLLATACTWVLYSVLSEVTVASIFGVATSLFYPYGLLMIASGAITIQVMRHYFRLFMPDSQEQVNETAVAMWLAAVPLFIFISVALLEGFDLNVGILSGLEHINLSYLFGGAVAITVIAMMGFEYVSSGSEAFRFERVEEIAKMIFCIVTYSILISAILRHTTDSIGTTLALQPFYWVGFAAGARILLRHHVRSEIMNAWQHIRKFLSTIIFVEVIGMVVYYFEFFALSDIDPTVVNLIIGAHVIPVFVCSIFLSALRRAAKAHNLEQVQVLGVSIGRDVLPEVTLTPLVLFWFTAVIITLSFALSLAHTTATL